MRNRRYRKNFLLRLTAALLIISILLTVSFFKMRPVIIRYAESVAETTLLNSANDAVLEILNEQGISYDDMVSLSKNEAGFVTSIETNIVKINSLKSSVANRLSKLVDSREYYELHLPIGTFLSNIYFNALGPEIHFKMQLTATAVVNFSHEFKSAGINQVLHMVMIDMDISGTFVTTGYRDTISVSTSAIAAQTVIVGAVPDAFTEVIESENDNTAGLINDYGAIPGY